MKTTIKFILIGLLLWTTVFGLRTNSYAAIPHLINYQGRLTDKDGKPLEGAYSLTFRIYDSETAGNLLWEETHSGVVIQKGIFSILLGSVTSLNLPFDKPYFLEIKVGNEVMSPRQRITSSGYAFMAENVTSLPRGVILLWSGSIANIPSGWALCDGTNGTPDLRDKFVKGIPNSYTNPGGTGGNLTHTHVAGSYVSPNHTHTGTTGGASGGTWGAVPGGGARDVTLPHGHSFTTDSGGSGSITGTSAASSSLPPYYEIAFIMKL